ncbi:Diaminopimelate epimerase-like protein [Byssothecium circinans]|uniref:Diaminopimelate epimerase-like protein n=1 Tax=Byssothecium circinans TaxID=147558 RepID=A0A6A5UEK3_9PLEO|nr:Diaminopimelate epimerase-like protein [Byssothecium circinans]
MTSPIDPSLSMESDLKLEFVIVDVFTQKKYEGNPLAIVRVPRPCTLTQEQKQNIAREFNLSETSFLHEQEPESGLEWTVDIFTTQEELPFAGHPTVGTACFALSSLPRERGVEGEIEASFKLKAGQVQLQYNATTGAAKAAIPHNVRIHGRTFLEKELLEIQPWLAEVNLKDWYPIVSIVKGMTFVLIELDSLEDLQRVSTTSLGPRLDGLDEGWSRTFIGTYFFVRTGKDVNGARTLRTRMIERTLEDPATGSAASGLAAYLSLTEGKPSQVIGYAITQGVEMGRRSEIQIQVLLKEDSGIDKVVLGGSAVRVMEGRLTV